MKYGAVKMICLVCLVFFSIPSFAQYNWKLSKEKDGIKVYQSSSTHSNFKSIKVACTLEGTYDKLIAILNNVSHLKDWVYHVKTGFLISRKNPDDYYYYTETYLPWPVSNRDAVQHMNITRDSLNRFVKIVAKSEPGYLPNKNGKVRVPYSVISWYVTAPSDHTIHIEYIFEAEPGGSLPAWIVNLFADKGSIETFEKLSGLLKK